MRQTDSNELWRLRKIELIVERRTFAVVLSLLMILSAGHAGSTAQAMIRGSIMVDEYVCPPCGCGNDAKVSDKPGVCNICGMALVLKGSQAAAPAPPPRPEVRKKVAILIFDGVQIIDYTGPYEVFGAAGLEVFTVAASAAPITTNMGMKVTPHFALGDAPAADVLLIPGGGVVATQKDPTVIKWIQERSKQAEYVISVCNGAYILARTGLLDGLTATTTAWLIDGLAAIAPKVKVVRDQRYVDNGKFITTAGLSSGIDGALYLVSKMFGKARAQLTALGMEYDWKGDSKYARANLADRHLRKVLGPGLVLPAPQGAKCELLSTEGAADNWEMKWQVVGDSSPAAALKLLNDTLVAGQWIEQGTGNRAESRRAWRFNDQEGGAWSGASETQPGGSKIVIVTLKIERTGEVSAKHQSVSEPGSEKLIVRDAWIQEMPPSIRITAAHLIIDNPGGTPTALIGARAAIARVVELHRAEMDNGMMRMRKLERIELPAGKTDLSGELHLMLIDLKTQLKEGDQVALTLEFQGGFTKTIMIPVKKRQTE